MQSYQEELEDELEILGEQIDQNSPENYELKTLSDNERGRTQIIKELCT